MKTKRSSATRATLGQPHLTWHQRARLRPAAAAPARYPPRRRTAGRRCACCTAVAARPRRALPARLLRPQRHHDARRPRSATCPSCSGCCSSCSSPLVGGVAWLVAGRPQGPARSLPYKGNRGDPAGVRPARSRRRALPDDDEDFLRGLRERAEEQRRRAEQERAAARGATAADGGLTCGTRRARSSRGSRARGVLLAARPTACSTSPTRALPRPRAARGSSACCSAPCGRPRLPVRRPGRSPAAPRAGRPPVARPDDDADFLRAAPAAPRSSAARLRRAETRRRSDPRDEDRSRRRSGVGVQADDEDVDDVVVDRSARRRRRRRPRRPCGPSSRRWRGRAGSRRRAPR